MRWFFTLILLAGLFAQAEAATVHHVRSPHRVILHPNQDEVTPSGWYRFPGYAPIPPEENRNLDPSTRGGG